MIPVRLYQDTCFPVSEDIIASLQIYLNEGTPCGGFLNAVLENNLSEAFGRADIRNERNLRNIIGYVRQYIPSDRWGSKERVDNWLDYVQKEKKK